MLDGKDEDFLDTLKGVVNMSKTLELREEWAAELADRRRENKARILAEVKFISPTWIQDVKNNPMAFWDRDMSNSQ